MTLFSRKRTFSANASPGASAITNADNGLTNNSGTVELGGTLIQNTSIDTDGNEFSVLSGDFSFIIGDSVRRTGNLYTDAGDSSTLYSGIVTSVGQNYASNIYQTASGAEFAGMLANPSTCIFKKVLDVVAGHEAGVTNSTFNDGLISFIEARRTYGGKTYGHSAHSDTSRSSADFYEFDPALGLDTKYIWIDGTAITSKMLYNISDANNYNYHFWTVDDDGFKIQIGNAVSGGSDTPSGNDVEFKMVNSVFNVKAALPEYANDAAADADTDLESGALYKVSGDRTLYQKP